MIKVSVSDIESYTCQRFRNVRRAVRTRVMGFGLDAKEARWIIQEASSEESVVSIAISDYTRLHERHFVSIRRKQLDWTGLVILVESIPCCMDEMVMHLTHSSRS